MKIKLIIGEDEEFHDIPKDYSIKDLLKQLYIASETVVVKKNNSLVIEEELMEEGDTIEIIKVIYGG